MGTGAGANTSMARTPVFLEGRFSSWVEAGTEPMLGAAIRFEVDGRVALGVVPRAGLSAALGEVRLRPFVGLPVFLFPYSMLGAEVGAEVALPLTGQLGASVGVVVDAYFWGSDLPERSALVMVNLIAAVSFDGVGSGTPPQSDPEVPEAAEEEPAWWEVVEDEAETESGSDESEDQAAPEVDAEDAASPSAEDTETEDAGTEDAGAEDADESGAVPEEPADANPGRDAGSASAESEVDPVRDEGASSASPEPAADDAEPGEENGT